MSACGHAKRAFVPIGAPCAPAEAPRGRLGHPSRAQEAGNSRQDPCTGAAPEKDVMVRKTPSAKTMFSLLEPIKTPPAPSTATDPTITALPWVLTTSPVERWRFAP